MDTSQKLGVRREHDVQAMDGRSRSASASSTGLVGPALRGIVQQFALVDRFDLSHTPTLHDRGPSLKSSPHTPHRSSCPGFRFRTDAFSVHALPVRLSAEVVLGWAASFFSHASLPPAPYFVMTALLLPDDQPHNHFPSHSTQCHAFIHASLYICSGRFLVSLIFSTYTRRVSSPRSYFLYSFSIPAIVPRLCRIMPRLPLLDLVTSFAPGSSLLHLFGPRPTLRGRAAGEGALAERGRRVWSGGVSWEGEATGEEVGVLPEAESTPSSPRRVGCCGWVVSSGGVGGRRG